MIGSAMYQMAGSALLVLTPTEKWSAARRMSPTLSSGNWLAFVAVGLLIVLGVLLVYVSYQQRTSRRSTATGGVTEPAERHGLTNREYRILEAIAALSGLDRAETIFRQAKAFTQGAARLEAECQENRAPHECVRLQEEIAAIRAKLGFAAVDDRAEGLESPEMTTRDISTGKVIELTCPGRDEQIYLQGKVVANDSAGLVVELASWADTHVDQPWRVQYCDQAGVWQFETATVSSSGTIVTLAHTKSLYHADRRRFPRFTVTVPVLVAPFPPMRAGAKRAFSVDGSGQAVRISGRLPFTAPKFVRGTLIEMAGPGLQVEAPVQVASGDRVLVVFGLPLVGMSRGAKRTSAVQWEVVEGLGYVTDCRPISAGMLIVIELTDFSDADAESLTRFASDIASLGSGLVDDGGGGTLEEGDAGAVVDEPAIAQGV
jgi:hypothetical protein